MILVTGANGLIGSQVCKLLLANKKPFIALIRENSNLELLADIKDSIRFHIGEVNDIPSLEEIFGEVTTVIHTAALVSYLQKEKEELFRINAEGTENLVNLALHYNTNYFVHVSSIAAIGNKPTNGIINENEKWDQNQSHTNYAQSKYLAELEIHRGMSEGLNAAIINPSLVLGQGDWNKSSSQLFKYIWNEGKYYSEGQMNYVDVRDVADIILKLEEKQITNERYIVNGGSISYKDFLTQVANNFNKKPPHIAAKPWMVKFALLSETIKSTFTGKKPLITRETARVSKNKIYFDNSKIKSELNHNFVPLSDTLEWVCQFYKEKQKK